MVENMTFSSAWVEIISWSVLGIGLSLGLKYLAFDDEISLNSGVLVFAVIIVVHILKSYTTISRWFFGARNEREAATPTAPGNALTLPVSTVSNEPLGNATNELMELRQMADVFGSRIPEGRFTAAEIQGFLLMHMDDPLAALEKIDPWVEKMGAAKNLGKNVISNESTAEGGKSRSGKLTSKQRADSLARIQYEGAPEALSDEFLISLLAKTNPTQPDNTSLPNVVFVKGSPSSALFPSDATGIKKLTAYFSYSPKGAATTEDEIWKQKTTVESFNQARQGVEPI